MQIQRLQTLLLLIAAVLVGWYCFSPLAVEAAATPKPTPHFVHESIILLTVNVLIAVLLVIMIFMYGNPKLQRKLTFMSLILICASLVSSIFFVYNNWPGAEFYWFGGIILLIFALFFGIWAYMRIGKDIKLLGSYDRLR